METKGVEERTKGTMVEVKGQKSPEAEAKTPEDASKVSPEETPKYTQKQLDALVHAARSEVGREKKTLEIEVTSLKSQIQIKDDEVSDNTTEVEKLQAKVDELASDDPDKFNAVKELRAAKDERRQLKVDRNALEAEKQTHGETVKLAQETLREVAVWEVAAEYEGSDPVRLKDLCDTFEAKSDEQIRKVAETLWAKKTAETETPPLKPYSGITEGGQEDLNKLSPDEKIKWALDHQKKRK